MDDETSAEMKAWSLDHPGGVIADEELASMDRYSGEASDAEHIPTIEERESVTADRPVYRARCRCGWLGWAVWDRTNAERQRDRHVEPRP